ncbi:DNA-binding protein [Clostridiaceae bacterium]|nr:DNA-binding protein [Clostridiaceae bacterium]
MKEILTVKEVAKLLKTSRVQVRKMIQNGELPAVMVGREYRIPVEVLDAFIKSNLS